MGKKTKQQQQQQQHTINPFNGRFWISECIFYCLSKGSASLKALSRTEYTIANERVNDGTSIMRG